MSEGATIENLQIEVSALSEDAQKSLTRLKDTLSDIKTTLGGGLGFSNMVKEMTGLSDTADKTKSKLDALRESFTKLQGAAKLGLPKNLEKISRFRVPGLNRQKQKSVQEPEVKPESMRRTQAAVASTPPSYNDFPALGPNALVNGVPAKMGIPLVRMQQELSEMALNPDLMKDSGFASELSRIQEELQKTQSLGRGVTEEMIENLRAAVDALRDYKSTLGDTNQTQAAATDETERSVSAWERLKAVLSSEQFGGNRLKNLFSKMLQLRIMRGIIMGTFKALKEGMTNLIGYGKIYKTDFYNAIQSGANAFLQLKNSVAAAASPIITALTPAFITLTNWIITALNALNQFFSILTGATHWTMAENVTASLGKIGAGAGSAKKKMDGLLADWDELNVIQSENDTSGGGGGGSSLKDMFSEQEFSPWMMWVKDHLDIIKSLALGIGAAFLTWKIGKMLGLGLKDTWKYVIGIGLVVAGVTEAWQGFADQLENGIDWENLKMSVLGVVGVVAGLGLMFGLTGVAVGLLAGGVYLAINPIKELIETGKLADESLTQLSIAVGAVGIGLALLTGSWIPLAVAGIAIAVAWIVQKWDEIKAFFVQTWESISEWWKNTIQPAIDVAVAWVDTNIVQPVSGFFTSMGEFINQTLVDIGDSFKSIWETVIYPVVSWIDENITKPVAGFFTALWGTITGDEENNMGVWWSNLWKNTILPYVSWVDTNITQPIAGFFSNLWSGIIGDDETGLTALWNNLWNNGILPTVTWINENIITPISGFFTGLGDTIKSVFTDPIAAIKEAWTSITTWFHNNVTMPIANFFIDAMNGIISAINVVIGALNTINFTIPGITIPGIPGIWDGVKLFDDITIGISGIATLDLIPRVEAYAKGGFPKFGDLFLANENGAEMVGKFGNRTGVANNEQIVSGITYGVRSAISPLTQLLGESVRNFSRSSQLVTAGGYYDSGDWYVSKSRGADYVAGVQKVTTVSGSPDSDITNSVKIGNEGVENGLNTLINAVETGFRRGVTAKITPSTALARTVRRSEEMRLASEGV